jgi:hypothetical protein
MGLQREGPLFIAGLNAVLLGQNPESQKVHWSRGRRIIFTVPDPGPSCHPLHLTGTDHRPVAHAVLVLQGPLQDIGENFHVTMPMGGEAGARLHAVLIEHPQLAKAHIAWIVIAIEGERVIAVEPIKLRMPRHMTWSSCNRLALPVMRFFDKGSMGGEPFVFDKVETVSGPSGRTPVDNVSRRMKTASCWHTEAQQEEFLYMLPDSASVLRRHCPVRSSLHRIAGLLPGHHTAF